MPGMPTTIVQFNHFNTYNFGAQQPQQNAEQIVRVPMAQEIEYSAGKMSEVSAGKMSDGEDDTRQGETLSFKSGDIDTMLYTCGQQPVAGKGWATQYNEDNSSDVDMQ